MGRSRRQIRVGLLGLGTVGEAVADILRRHARLIEDQVGVELKVVRALVRRPRKKRSGAAARVPLTRCSDAVVAAEDVDVVVELLGGVEPARRLVLSALAAGKPVVTANKAILARHGTEILDAASAAEVDIHFEAAVAGGIPIVRALREGLASDRITGITGVLNGTTNYILTRMAAGEAYRDALATAQRLGFAEADPTLDVGGGDAADKLAILSRLAFGTVIQPEAIPTVGITELTPAVLRDAQDLGYSVKLLAIARRNGGTRGKTLDLRVHPAFVSNRSALSAVPGAQNAIAVDSDSLGTTLFQGPGAGGLPTGSAVVSDLIAATRNLRAGIPGRLRRQRSAPRLLPPDKAVSSYYARLLVAERPGVLASVTRVFAKHAISLATVLQRERGSASHPVPVVLTTHPAPHGAMERALAALSRLPALKGGQVVRIETPD